MVTLNISPSVTSRLNFIASGFGVGVGVAFAMDENPSRCRRYLRWVAADPFDRMDPSPDEAFYATSARSCTSSPAIEALREAYAELVPPGGGCST